MLHALSMPNLPETAADLRRARDRLSQVRQGNAVKRRELDRQDTEIDAAIAALDAVLALTPQPDSGADLYYQGPSGAAMAVQIKSREPKDTPASVRTAIARLLSSERRPFETAEIVGRVAEFGAVEVQPATTRSILAKMHKSGEVEQVKRGLYRLARPTTSSPSGADAEVVADASQLATGRVWVPNYSAALTVAEFMASPPHLEDYEPEPSNEEYSQLNIEAAQAHLEEQADRGDAQS